MKTTRQHVSAARVVPCRETLYYDLGFFAPTGFASLSHFCGNSG
jgi:hypothetical protein